jgi:hypothetical protein
MALGYGIASGGGKPRRIAPDYRSHARPAFPMASKLDEI